MKTILASLVLISVSSAHAFLGYDFAAINAAEVSYIQHSPKVRAAVAAVGGKRFVVQTSRHSFRHVVTTDNGCQFIAKVTFESSPEMYGGYNPRSANNGMTGVILSKPVCR